MIKRINPKKNLVIGFGITDKTISSLKSANGLLWVVCCVKLLQIHSKWDKILSQS